MGLQAGLRRNISCVLWKVAFWPVLLGDELKCAQLLVVIWFSRDEHLMASVQCRCLLIGNRSTRWFLLGLLFLPGASGMLVILLLLGSFSRVDAWYDVMKCLLVWYGEAR